jgi:drug/metabolite transporter (DMT)-like permease
MRGSRIDWLIFVALGFAWGSSYLFIKIGVESLPPFTLIACRLGIGSAFLGVAMWLMHETLPRDPRVYGRLVIMALVNIAIPFTLITVAEQTIDSAMAAVLNSTVPLFTIVVAAAVFPEEAITVNRLIGLIVGFVGVVLVVSRGLEASIGAGTGGLPIGELLVLLSSLLYCLGAVYARGATRDLRPMIPAFFQVFFAFLTTAALALLLERPWTLSPTGESIGAVIWLGIFGSGFAYLFFFRLLQDWGPTRTSMVAYVLPVVGIVLGAIVLNEVIDARIVVGTALIVGGIALVNSKRGRRRLIGRAPAPTAASAASAGPTS